MKLLKRKQKIEGDKEVDLAALVDIFSNMLFFLLATVALIRLTTVSASVPAEGPGDGGALRVSVEVSALGYAVEARRGAIVEKSVGIARNADGSLDTVNLARELWDIKKGAPELRDILVAPDATVLFDEIVQTMDASREMKSVVDPSRKVPLFPRPVLVEKA